MSRYLGGQWKVSKWINDSVWLLLHSVIRYFDATIDMIAADGETCTLTFNGYNTTEIVKLCDIRPRGWEEEEEGRVGTVGTKRRKVDARANAK